MASEQEKPEEVGDWVKEVEAGAAKEGGESSPWALCGPTTTRFCCSSNGCYSIIAIVDGVIPPRCPKCNKCVFGWGCDGGHPPILYNPDLTNHRHKAALLARTLHRLIDGRACRYEEVLNWPQALIRAENMDNLATLALEEEKKAEALKESKEK